MKQMNIYVLAIIFMLALSSCAEMQGRQGQFGAVGGAAGGALIGQMIGHNSEATLIGAAVGTMLGYLVGNEMDKYDLSQLNRVLEHGASNQVSRWINPDNGNRYQVTPQKPIYRKPAPRQQNYGRYHRPEPQRVCRRAEIVAIIDGRQEKTYTTACRDANGHWQLQ